MSTHHVGIPNGDYWKLIGHRSELTGPLCPGCGSGYTEACKTRRNELKPVLFRPSEHPCNILTPETNY
jgi:hypothetical protein